jgi:hypothetical protein
MWMRESQAAQMTGCHPLGQQHTKPAPATASSDEPTSHAAGCGAASGPRTVVREATDLAEVGSVALRRSRARWRRNLS